MPLGWTDDRVAQLKTLWAEGKSCSEIAGILGQGLTRNAVIGKVHRLNLQDRAVHPPHSVRPAGEASRPKKSATPISLGGPGLSSPKKPDRAVPAGSFRAARPRMAKPPIPALAPVSHFSELFADGFEGQRGRVAISDPKNHHCRFPIDMPERPVMYCGLQKDDGSSYCAAHRRRCDPDQPRTIRQALAQVHVPTPARFT
ncbi:GcrA family cell cycle regulator [Aestuariivirga litoralis]|uniref:GcrA family cell cycle regulator n=1 Tax=Aestuariivirga litoralis TaxID=2650924 RepID=UPI0018C7683A|nr:GcrA family cell cycle regulator [Aestuariivirga litoralis]